jgi:biopolymer transport protein TolR
MGAAIGSDDKKSRNVELNIVPFIDLMSCLTAFLLVTAAWVNIAQMNTKTAGRSKEAPTCDGDTCEDPKLSLLVEKDQIWIGVSRLDEFETVPRTGAGYDWKIVLERLKAHKSGTLFRDTRTIEIAAHSAQQHPSAYQDLVAAMETAIQAGFDDVGLTDVNGLSARPRI